MTREHALSTATMSPYDGKRHWSSYADRGPVVTADWPREPRLRSSNAATPNARRPAAAVAARSLRRSSTGGEPVTHLPTTGLLGPGVEHGTDGADPVVGEGRVKAMTTASARTPNPTGVHRDRAGSTPRPKTAAAAQMPSAITTDCAGVKSRKPKTFAPPVSQAAPEPGISPGHH
jgi:hypothetical protein